MPSRCPSGERLRALLSEQAEGVELTSLAEHLEACEQCRQRLEAMAAGADWLPGDSAPPPDSHAPVPASLRALMDRLRAWPGLSDPGQSQAPPEVTLGFLSPADRAGILGWFGPYEVIEEIARGAMGIVLKARDPALNRIVAIKVLAPTLATHPAARARFLREARAAAAISHEHVVDIHAVDEANGLPYLVMQFIAGQSLAQRVRQTGPLGLAEMLRIGTQIASGLAAAHAQGLVHRDIKPGNILLENGVERVRIADFGLAKVADDTTATQSGWLAGTPEFMAPEQARGQPVDHRADLFSLGGVLYYMATGRSPFADATLLAVIRRVCEGEIPPLHLANPALPDWFGELVGQLLAKDPARRPQSAAQVAAMLEDRLAQVQGASPSPVPNDQPVPSCVRSETPCPPSHRRTVGRGIVTVSLAVVGLAIVAFALRHVATRLPKPLSQGAFRVLGANDRLVLACTNLAEAVRAARSGDTIEVQGDGPFGLEPLALGDKALVIRAATGFHPAFITGHETGPALATEARLVLEGLEFEARDGRRRPLQREGLRRGLHAVVSSSGAPLFMANCRLQSFFRPRSGPFSAVCVTDCPLVELRNCEIDSGPGRGVVWVSRSERPGLDSTQAERRLWIENGVHMGDTMLWLDHRAPVRAAVTLAQNTVAAWAVIVLTTPAAKPGLSLIAETNLFDCHVFVRHEADDSASDLREALNWKGRHNLFGAWEDFVSLQSGRPGHSLTNLTAWSAFWNQTNNGTVQAPIWWRPFPDPGGPILTFGDFQLNDSHYDQITAAGGDRSIRYGASLERGPGLAYHAWRQSPEYRRWQERIRQSDRERAGR